jgi:hypothetical protein
MAHTMLSDHACLCVGRAFLRIQTNVSEPNSTLLIGWLVSLLAPRGRRSFSRNALLKLKEQLLWSCSLDCSMMV